MVKKLFAAALLGMLFLGVMLPASTAQRTVYQNDKYGFSIAPPIGWAIEERSDDLPVTFFWGPLENNYRVHILIEIIENVSYLSLFDFTEAVKRSRPYAQVISEGGRMINGVEAYEIVSKRTLTKEDEVFELQEKVVLLSHDGVGYLVWFQALQDNYDKYLPLFEESVQTLKFEEKGLLRRIFDVCLP